MTTETILIKVREDGSRVVSRNLDEIGGAADRASGSISAMSRVLGVLAAGGVISGLVRMADTFTNMQNKLRLVTTGTENLNRVTKELLTISNQTRTDFESTAELYARVAGATKDMGLSQKETLAFTKSLNQAVVLSGASAEEAAGGIRQLSQGLASGTLRGDELNSVMENFPKVADVIAESMGKSRGEIRQLGADGKITADIIIEAFAKASNQLDQEFATTVPTVGQSFTVLKNNVLSFVGEMDKSLGITKKFSEFILILANNLDIIIPILTAVGVTIATTFVPGIITAFITQLKALWALVLANPFTALAAIIAGVITALYAFRDSIKLGIDDTTTLGDLMRAAWESLGPIIDAVAGTIEQIFINIGIWSDDAFGKMSKDAANSGKSTESTWLKVLRAAARTVDAILGMFLGLYDGIMRVFSVLGDNISKVFTNLGNAKDKLLDGQFSDAIAEVNKNQDVWKGTGERLGQAMRDGLDTGFGAIAAGGFESKLDNLIDRAQEIGKARIAAEAANGDLGGGGKPPPKPPVVDPDAAKKAARELERLKDALTSVLDQANPVAAATRQLAEAQDILTRAVSAGLISQSDAKTAYEELAYQMRDQLDPLAALNRELDEHTKLLRMSSEQAHIEQQVVQLTQQLRRDGIKLTQDEIAQLRAKLVVEQELSRIAQVRDQLESESQSRRNRDLLEKINTAGSMAASGEGGYTASDAVTSLAGDIPGLSQTTDFLAAQQEQYAAYYAAIDEMRQNDLLSETGAAQAKMAIFQEQYAVQFQAASAALGNLSSLQRSENKKQAAIGKAAAVAQTIINTYQSATGAYSAMASIPYVGPFLGAAAAAAAVAAGMANVQAIRSQNVGFRTGGSMVVGGSGGTDSQTVALRATPGERINIHTPAQARALERLGEEDNGPRRVRSVNVNQTVVIQGKPDKRTPEQYARATRREARKEYERS